MEIGAALETEVDLDVPFIVRYDGRCTLAPE